MVTKNETEPVFELPLGDIYRFGGDSNVVKFTAEWATKQFGVICDLDLNAYCYDERARFIEKLDVSQKRTLDGAVVLMADIDGQQSQTSNTYCELLKMDFRLVDPATTAILFVLDGGSKYFQLVSQMWVHCAPWVGGKAVSMPGQKAPLDLFSYSEKAKKEFQAVGLAVLFRDGWMEEDETRAQWCIRALMEPMFVTTKKAKDEKCLSIVVGNVPSLEKYKPRLFGAVKDLCSALSSLALPKLKKKFIATPGGLDITTFTEVIFKQLYETHPLIIEPSESAYTVAMIQEMFQQIDYNGDGGADWDEFTTFCIQTASAQDTAGQVVSLDEYVIEYNEDITLRETKSTAFRPAAKMKYFPEVSKFVVIPDEQDKILIMNKRFKTRCILKADNMIVKGKTGAKEVMKKNEEESSKVLIYDVVFLAGRDMYAFSASDHGISICKEQGNAGSKKVNILLYTKIYHTELHHKLCWSKNRQILCSVGSDRVIYGWDIDKPQPIFQVTRHNDIITDFISVDHLDCFITCSMDKRIVMWSAVTRRVKGIMVGHLRGVRCLSAYETTLLSAGYELDARTWDLNSKENVALLRGHRQPIVDAKLMCELCSSEKDYRAITVDESGEIRLWNIYVAERTSDPVPVPTLQTFTMLNPEYPMKYVRFLAVPNSQNLSQSYYSDLVGCGTRMLHFVPEKNVKEFIPPSSAVFSEAAAELMVAVGRKLLKYDVCTGAYVGSFEPYPLADLSALSLELPRCRRLFTGTSNGQVMIVNYDSGLVLDQVPAHQKEVSCILIHNGDRNQVFSGSIDGRLVLTEECDGELHIHNTIDRAFGDNPNGLPIGIANIKLAPEVGAVIVQSAGLNWGIWDLKTFKRRLIFCEQSVVMSFEVLGCSGDAEDEKRKGDDKLPASALDKLYQVTLAVALQPGIKIITCDISEARGICTHFLMFDKPIYITTLTLLKTPEGDSVNYAVAKATGKRISLALTGTTDEGKIAVWEVEGVRFKSEKLLKRKFPFSGKSISSSPVKSALPNIGGSHPATPSTPTRARQQLWTPTDDEARPATSATDGSSPGVAAGNIGPAIAEEPSVLSLSSSVINSLAIDASVFFGPPARAVPVENIACASTWAAHLDSVCVVVPMHEHGCLVTGSHDGYKRVWNMDSDCLGELQLPNMTYKMKHPLKPIFPPHSVHWKFILEKLAILDHHRMLATYMAKLVLIEEGAEERERSKHVDFSGLAGLLADGDGEDGDDREMLENMTEQERLRFSMLKAMVEPVKVPEDGPPLSLPSRADRRLQAIADALEAHAKELEAKTAAVAAAAAVAATSKHATDQGGELFNLTELTLARSSSPGGDATDAHGGRRDAVSTPTGKVAAKRRGSTFTASTDVSTLPEVQLSPKGGMQSPAGGLSPGQSRRNSSARPMSKSSKPRNLYYAAGENVTDKAYAVPPAFSEASLVSGQLEKSLDEEGLLLLRRFATTTREKVEQYEASGSTILLRSPSLSTSIVLPELSGMRRAEISFGPQKDLYKNAERELNERDNLKADKMRDAITRSRIDHNVKKLSSMMMSVITPSSHDEVHIPNPAEAWKEMQDRDAKEQFRMRVRLMQSASLVSLLQVDERAGEGKDASSSSRPLDREGLNRLAAKVNAAYESETERQADLKYAKRSNKERSVLEPTAKEALIRKFRNAIRDEYLFRTKAEMAATPLTASMGDGTLEEYPFPNQQQQQLLPKSPAGKFAATFTADGGGSESPTGLGTPTNAGGVGPGGTATGGRQRRNTATFAADVKGGSGVPGGGSRAQSRSQPPQQVGEEESKASASSDPAAASAANSPGAGDDSGTGDDSNEYKGQGVSNLVNRDTLKALHLHGTVGSGIGTPNTSESGHRERGGGSESAGGARPPKKRVQTAQSTTTSASMSSPPKAGARGPAGSPPKPGTASAAAALVSTPVPTTTGSASKTGLTTRQLLPFYRLEDVQRFLEIFARVDENFSGDLDMEEWTQLFKSISNNIPAQEARSIFMKFKNEDGFLSMKELAPVVFSRASKEQLRLIVAHCNSEIVKKTEGLTQLTFNELERLFETFDLNNFGYVAVSTIREEIRNLTLPDSMINSCLQSFKYVDDDEMISPNEFTRFFKMYLSKAELLAQDQAAIKEKFKVS